MRWQVLTFLATALVLVTPAVQSAARAELILNGNFETGNFDSWTLGGDTTDPTTFWVDSSNPQSGTFAAYFGPYPNPITLSQTIATIPGTAYLFSFWLTNEPGSTNNSFSAGFGGSTLENLVNTNVSPYTLYNYTVVATSATTLVNFSFTQDFGFFNIDNISVTQAVPEPSALVSAGLGLAIAGVYRLSTRKKATPQG